MDKDKFFKGINKIRNIAMTSAEKRVMKERILATPIKSPWSIYSFNIWLQHNRWAYGTLAAVIILVGGGGIVSASQGSLPGDALYAVKTNIVEPTQELLAATPIAKAELQSSFATERLQEAEQLASQGNLDTSKEKQINDLLDGHTKAFNVAVAKVDQSDSSEVLNNKFKVNMRAHARLLETIGTQDKNEKQKDEIVKVAENARTLGSTGDAPGVTVMAATIAPVAAKVSAVAPNISVAPAIESADKYVKNSSKDNKKKKLIRNLIDQTRADVMSIGTDTTPLAKSVIDSTQQTLDQAEQSLKDANWQDDQGDAEGAKNLLKQSEQSAAEADVLLHAGLRLEKGGRGHSKDN